MEAFHKIQKLVRDGNVLDDTGSFVPLTTYCSSVKTIVHELAKGNVLNNGQWVSIAQAQKAEKSKPAY
jgi:hypothetical protein